MVDGLVHGVPILLSQYPFRANSTKKILLVFHLLHLLNASLIIFGYSLVTYKFLNEWEKRYYKLKTMYMCY